MDKVSEILSIEQLREMATPIIEIPDFEGSGTIKVRVRKPKLMKMATSGEIPNHLMGIAVSMTTGEPMKNYNELNDKEKIKLMGNAFDLFCKACLVEPTYEEFEEIMTDDQKGAIFNWANGMVSDLNSFRDDKTDDTHDNDGKEVSGKTK